MKYFPLLLAVAFPASAATFIPNIFDTNSGPTLTNAARGAVGNPATNNEQRGFVFKSTFAVEGNATNTGNLSVTGNVTNWGDLYVRGRLVGGNIGSGVGKITLPDADGSNTNTIEAPTAITTDYSFIMPTAPASGFLLGANVNGAVSHSWSVNGGTLTNLTQTNLASTVIPWNGQGSKSNALILNNGEYTFNLSNHNVSISNFTFASATSTKARIRFQMTNTVASGAVTGAVFVTAPNSVKIGNVSTNGQTLTNLQTAVLEVWSDGLTFSNWWMAQ